MTYRIALGVTVLVVGFVSVVAVASPSGEPNFGTPEPVKPRLSIIAAPEFAIDVPDGRDPPSTNSDDLTQPRSQPGVASNHGELELEIELVDSLALITSTTVQTNSTRPQASKVTIATSVTKTPATTAAKKSTTTTTTTKATTTTPKNTTADARFTPGDNVSSIVSSSPSGTVFAFAPGIYKGLSISPKKNQHFIGEPGAVLKGNGKTSAFKSGNPNVTIEGLEITGYSPEAKDGAIHGTGGATGWTIKNNHVHHNGEVGVDGIGGWKVLNNNIHHNGRYGITLSGSNGLVQGNEIAYNSTDYGATGASGGTKFVKTTGLILRNNFVHDNYGNGLWVDIDNVGYVVEGNDLVGNRLAGINIEISCGGTVRNNYAKGNGHGDKTPNWINGSGIFISMSPGVEVYGNTLVNNPGGGIGAIQWDHPDVASVTKCTPQLKNLSVHNNTITQSGGAAAGIDANNYRDKVWSSWNNKFANNIYKLSNGARHRWGGDWVDANQWASAGLS